MSARTLRLRRMAAALAIAAVCTCAAVLAGCTGSTPVIEATAAGQLQSSVVAIAHSAAAGNAGQALSRLDQLSTAVQADTASGAITGERAAVIRAAIAKVRADLAAAIHSTPATAAPSPGSSGSSPDSGSSPAPSNTPAPTTGGAGGGSSGSGGSTPPPPTSTSSPSDSPTSTPSTPPPTSVSTSGP